MHVFSISGENLVIFVQSQSKVKVISKKLNIRIPQMKDRWKIDVDTSKPLIIALNIHVRLKYK